jgi:hypothetical protein
MGGVSGNITTIDASSKPFPDSVEVNVNGKSYYCTADGAAAFNAARQRAAENPNAVVNAGEDSSLFSPSTWLSGAPAAKNQQFPTP